MTRSLCDPITELKYWNSILIPKLNVFGWNNYDTGIKLLWYPYAVWVMPRNGLGYFLWRNLYEKCYKTSSLSYFRVKMFDCVYVVSCSSCLHLEWCLQQKLNFSCLQMVIKDFLVDCLQKVLVDDDKELLCLWSYQKCRLMQNNVL